MVAQCIQPLFLLLSLLPIIACTRIHSAPTLTLGGNLRRHYSNTLALIPGDKIQIPRTNGNDEDCYFTYFSQYHAKSERNREVFYLYFCHS